MKGWICSYRDIWIQPFFKGHGMRVAIWHWLLHHAAWEPVGHTVGTAKITLNRGEVCFSQQQICDDTGATRKQVRDVLDYLVQRGKGTKIGANERANAGATVRANARSVLIIENYDEYQNEKKEGANARAATGATKGPTKEQGNKQQEAKASVDADVVGVLSQVFSRDVSEDWVAFRRELKKPMSLRMANSMVKLVGLHGNPDAVLNYSISNGYQGIFPDKVPGNQPQFKAIDGGRYDQRNHRQNQSTDRQQNRPDPALEQIARLAGIGSSSGNGGR